MTHGLSEAIASLVTGIILYIVAVLREKVARRKDMARRRIIDGVATVAWQGIETWLASPEAQGARVRQVVVRYRDAIDSGLAKMGVAKLSVLERHEWGEMAADMVKDRIGGD